ERVDAPVLEAERAARAGVGGIAGAERVAVSPARVGVDAHRHDVRAAIGIPGQHLEVGEVLRVVEGELGAQHLREIEGVALLVAQVTAYQRLADHVLADAGGAEVITLTGIELEPDVRPAVGRVDDQLVANEARVIRSEEHTSELQSLAYLVCRLLLEKKKNY